MYSGWPLLLGGCKFSSRESQIIIDERKDYLTEPLDSLHLCHQGHSVHVIKKALWWLQKEAE